jgi:hypothetical protein
MPNKACISCTPLPVGRRLFGSINETQIQLRMCRSAVRVRSSALYFSWALQVKRWTRLRFQHRVGADLLQPVCLRALTIANPDRNSATRGCSRGGWRKRDAGFRTLPAGRNASSVARRVLGCLCGATDQCWGGQTLYPLPPRVRCGRSFSLASIRLLRPKRAPSSSWRRARPGGGRRRLLG